MESLSAYARQFLGQMDKPDVDHIEGLSPAISIDQKTTSRNPRSTVATVTEVYDYLRAALRARRRAALPGVRAARSPGRAWSRSPTRSWRCRRARGSWCWRRWCADRKGEHRDVLEQMRRREGFSRVAVDGETYAARRASRRWTRSSPTRSRWSSTGWSCEHDLRRRLTDSLETARARATGTCASQVTARAARSCDLLRALRLPGARRVLPRAGAAHLLVQLPLGTCPDCTGLGFDAGGGPGPGGSDPERTLRGGRGACPGPTARTDDYDLLLDVDRRRRHSTSTWTGRGEAAQAPARHCCSNGPEGASASFLGRRRKGGGSWGWFEGVCRSSRRQHATSMSQAMRESVEQFMSLRPCPACGGARLRPESLAVTVGGRNIYEVCLLSVADAVAFFASLELSDTQAPIGARVIQEIHERLRFLDDVGVGYLTLARAAGDAVGRRGQRIRLATQIGVGPGRGALHPRRAVHRAAPARQPQAASARSSACATRATRCWWSSTTRR